MKLEQITIEGYRAHSKTTFSLEDDLTVLVGSNNTGKTSLVEVIDKFIGQTGYAQQTSQRSNATHCLRL